MQWVAAEIHQRAAALRGVVADILRVVGDVDAELGAENTDRAEPGLKREEMQEGRVVAVVESLGENAARRLSSGDHRARLGGGCAATIKMREERQSG